MDDLLTEMVRRRRLLSVVALAGMVAVGTGLVLAFGLPSVDEVRAWAGTAGWATPLLFAAVYALLTLTPVPASVLTVGAGLLFGLPLGLAVVMSGAMTGAAVAFALSRGLGRAFVAGVDSARLRRLDAALARHGLVAVIGFRLVPVLPFGALNYACGVTAVRARDYLVGTAIGVLPAVAAYVSIGAYGAQAESFPLALVLAVGGLGVLIVGGLVVRHRRDRSTAVPE